MNCQEANNIPITGFLVSKGIHPDKPQGNMFWYRSPLRNEDTASFKVDRLKNVWFDYGMQTGGHLIDLVCKMYNVSVSGALLVISGLSPADPSLSFFKKPDPSQHESSIKILNVQQLQNKALIQYLISRKVNVSIASKFVEEVHYSAYPGSYFSIGFKNDKGGYELRNGFKTKNFPSGFKGACSPKSITTIPGQNRSAVNVFEGFMDLLSALTYFKTDRPSCDVVVLNGVGLVKNFLQVMGSYSKINLFLDNDPAGKKTAAMIMELRPDAFNRSESIYPGFKDFNGFICS
ncbi:MAG: toprim domain-containing protein [Bacteroidetes bacterium]|nr:toprim domain-containing protein [Bacteroidota bacterium]MCL6101609.1 toprim domain-containing protein [Bacteroidota bacterium]